MDQAITLLPRVQNAIFLDGCRKNRIQHKRTTPYNPQTKGVVERSHRTLKDCLRKLVNNNTSAWEAELARALWAYRISDSQARGSSPFALIYGREPDRTDVVQVENEPHKAQRYAIERMEMAKEKRRIASTGQPLPNRELSVGDMITINAPEPITLSHLRDHALRVVEVRGKVIAYTRPLSQQPNKVQRVHIDRVQRVPADISWDDVRPRQHRSRTGPDVRTLSTAPIFTPASAPAQEETPPDADDLLSDDATSPVRVTDKVAVKADKRPARPSPAKRRRSRRIAAKRNQAWSETETDSDKETPGEEPQPPTRISTDNGTMDIVQQDQDQALERTPAEKRTAESTDSDWRGEQPPTQLQRVEESVDSSA